MEGASRDDQGYVILFTLMFILVLTIMGLVAVETSIFEIKISENNRRFSQEMSFAEAALNHAVANFRQLTDSDGVSTTEIVKVLNDTQYSSFKDAVYKENSAIAFPGTSLSLAEIEVVRVVNETKPDCGVDGDSEFCRLSKHAREVPTLSHRYYAGSIDKRRFAVTATAYQRNSNTLSSTWVQKGISLPAEQDKDIL